MFTLSANIFFIYGPLENKILYYITSYLRFPTRSTRI